MTKSVRGGPRVGVSDRAARLPDSRLGALLRLTRERQAIDLALGIPENPRPPIGLIEAACAALRGGRNQYADPAGDLRLRQRIAESFSTPADPEAEITVTSGASEALWLALMCSIDPGDEVVLLEPFYEHFLSAILLAGGIPRFVRLHRPGWRYDPAELAAAFSSRTRVMLLNTPHNPTGRMLDLDELGEIADLCDRWNVTVICNEAYSAYTFDGRPHISVADLPQLWDRSLVVGSLSKTHAISGWRLGYLRARAARTAVLRRAHMVTTAGSVAPLQAALGRYGLPEPPTAEMLGPLQRRRDRSLALLLDLGFTASAAEGGWYQLAGIDDLTDEHCEAFVHRLLLETGVLLAPGTPFTVDPALGSRLVRVTFNRSEATLARAERNLASVNVRPQGTTAALNLPSSRSSVSASVAP